MRASRLLSILLRLQTRGQVAATALATEHEVCVRTIYRDVDELSAAGVPVFAERGRYGGIALRDGYRARLTGLTLPEAETLMLADAGRVASELGVGVAATAAQLKLLAGLPPEARARAQLVAARFHLDPLPWYGHAPALPLLPRIAEAVWGDQRLRIDYESWKGRNERNVDPLGLVLKGGDWYLVAAVRRKPRTFRVSGIRGIHLAPGPVLRPRGFELGRFWIKSSREFESRLQRERARVRLSREGMRLLRDFHPGIAAQLLPAEPSATTRDTATAAGPDASADWIEADIPVEGLPQATRQLLSLGTEVEVIRPVALRRAISRAAAQIARRHRRVLAEGA